MEKKLIKSMQEQIQLMNRYSEVSQNNFTTVNEMKVSMNEMKFTMNEIKETVNLKSSSSNQTQSREVVNLNYSNLNY
jgi:hypothetical protein